MRSGKWTWFFIGLVFIVPLAAYTFMNWYQSKFEKLPFYTVPAGKERLLQQLPSFNLQNQEARRLDKNDWNDKILVVDFIFTHCPSICPKMTAALKGVSDVFDKESTIQIVSFTVDPERDSVEQLKKYATQFGINARQWNLVTGSKKDIYKLARNAFNIVATDGDGGPDDFIHSDNIVLIDRKKNIRGYYQGTNPTEIKQLVSDIKKLAAEN